MKDFKKILDIFIGVAALVVIVGLVLFAFNLQYAFIDDFILLSQIIGYAMPILIGIVCLRFTCDKIVWFILTIVFVALALLIYFNTPWFFEFIQSIFG